MSALFNWEIYHPMWDNDLSVLSSNVPNGVHREFARRNDYMTVLRVNGSRVKGV